MDQILSEATGGRSYEFVSALPDGPEPDLPPQAAEVFTVNHLTQGMYHEARLDTRYLTLTGLNVLACGQAEEENVVIRTSNAVTEKHLFWTFERENAPPLLPALTTSDPNEVPIGQELLFANVLPGLNGQQVWRVSGVNKYKLRKAKNAQSRYPIGTTPAEIAPAATRYYGPEQFSTAFIDARVGETVSLNQIFAVTSD